MLRHTPLLHSRCARGLECYQALSECGTHEPRRPALGPGSEGLTERAKVPPGHLFPSPTQIIPLESLETVPLNKQPHEAQEIVPPAFQTCRNARMI